MVERKHYQAIIRSATLVLPIGLALAAIALPSDRAEAVPAFAEQTGLPCQACHVGGFGPQLTPMGRDFKLNGYTMRSKGFNAPISAMLLASYTHTRADQNPPPDGVSHPNDNLVFDQGSIFLAGGIGQHFGGFAQFTYDGVGKTWAWDNLDLRAVTKGRLLGQDAVFGLTLNNSPTVQDAWNTVPAWGFPYTDTAVSGTPGAAPLIDGGLAQNTLGLSAYAWIGQKFYLEAGGYTSPAAGTLSWLGTDPLSRAISTDWRPTAGLPGRADWAAERRSSAPSPSRHRSIPSVTGPVDLPITMRTSASMPRGRSRPARET